MNAREAKFILESCRPGAVDASDPKIAEALRFVETDPALANWFAESQEFDRAVAAKLRSLPVPLDLPARIHAGRADSPRPRKWFAPRWFAAAALFLTLATATFLVLRPPAPERFMPGSAAAFQAEMVNFMDQHWDHSFDLSEREFKKVQTWLESRERPVLLQAPLTLAASRTQGCKTIAWNGTTATLICFFPEITGTVVHLIVVNRDALAEPPASEPQFARVKEWNTALWSSGDKTYLALTTADAEKLKACL